MAFLQLEVGKGVCEYVCVVCERVHQHPGISLCEFLRSCGTGRMFSGVCVCARAPLCQRVVDVFEQNFTATSPSVRLLCISPCYPSAGLSCHYSLSIHREVIVGKKPIRWAGQRIIEVMIGAVQRQLIVMEAGGRAGELSRLTVLSGGSGSARPECGITRRCGCSSVHFVFFLYDKNNCIYIQI